MTDNRPTQPNFYPNGEAAERKEPLAEDGPHITEEMAIGYKYGYAAAKLERDWEVEALLQSAQRYREALELIVSIYENHPLAGTLEMEQIADLLYNSARDAIYAPSKACESGEGGGK